jgi:hypothetical protein
MSGLFQVSMTLSFLFLFLRRFIASTSSLSLFSRTMTFAKNGGGHVESSKNRRERGKKTRLDSYCISANRGEAPCALAVLGTGRVT